MYYWLIQSGIKEGLLKILLWLIPVLWLIRRYKAHLYISLKDMFAQKVNWLKQLPIFALFTIYIVVGVLL